MVTLKEIATAVGVSSTTVSRVLNFDSTLSISNKKRQAIIETAEMLNYATPRNRARQHQSGATKIALVHFLRPNQELSDPYYVAMRLGVESRCAELKIETVKVYHTDARPDATLLRDASGVIAIGRHGDDEIAWLQQHARHLVFADFMPEQDEIDCVQADVSRAMERLLREMFSFGYRRIAYIGWSDRRAQAYVNGMRNAGIFEERLYRSGDSTEDGGYRLACEILQERKRPEALIAFNDSMAVGAYRALHEAGVRIPDDMAVVSFNDISAAQFLNPPLSTVRLPAEEIGETAVELLLERMAGRELAKRITLATHLIWRGSVLKREIA